DWSSFRVNFFLLLDPAHAGALPHTWLASFHLPPGHAQAMAQLSRDYSNLSLVDVDDLLARIRQIVDRVDGAVRWILGFGLLAGLTAALGSAGAGLWLGRSVFRIDGFVPPAWPLALGALGCAFVVMLLGLAGTRKVTRTSPMRLLREG